jgi:U3 small nucleolar ribonucleoprotein component
MLAPFPKIPKNEMIGPIRTVDNKITIGKAELEESEKEKSRRRRRKRRRRSRKQRIWRNRMLTVKGPARN